MTGELSASGTPWCSTASELRAYIASSTLARRQVMLDQSDSVLAAVRAEDCIHAYFISDTPSDLLLIGAVFAKFQQKRSHETVYGLSRPVVLVIVHESQRDSLDSVLAVIEQRSAQKLQEILESRVWVLRNGKDDRDSRLVMVAGIPDRQTLTDNKQYQHSVRDASERVADMMERCAFDAKLDRFIVYNTTCPVLLSSLPKSTLDRINAVAMVGTFKVDSSMGQFRIDESFYPYGSNVAGLSRAARDRFRIIYIDFSFSSNNKIKSLHHLPEFTRLAGAARNQDSKSCVAKARYLLKDIDSQYVWADHSVERSSYDNQTLKKYVAAGTEMAATMNCPVNGLPDSMACLIPSASADFPSTDLLAARVHHKAGNRGTHSADLALAQNGPEYMLITMQGAAKIDDAFLGVWREFISSVQNRSSIPRISNSMAQSWKDFLRGTMSLVEMLCDDEKKRKDAENDMQKMQKNMVEGDFTMICKTSLGK